MSGSQGSRLPIGSPEAQSVLRGLRNGAPAAARLETIVWHPGTDQHYRRYEGLIGGIRFAAD